MITAIIVEDERLARIGLHQLLEAHRDMINILGEADTCTKAIELIELHKPDLLFLDIHLPDMSGLEMLEKLSYQPKIIFTTAYREYAIDAFEKMSVDYLVKPISQERFDKSIEKLNEFAGRVANQDQKKMNELLSLLDKRKQKKEVTTLPIKKQDKIILLDLEDIAFLKSEDKYVSVQLLDGKMHLTDKSLNALEDKLSDQFIRVHRSYIVNKNEVLEIEKYFKGTLILCMRDKEKTRIKTGETYSKKVKEILGIA